MNAIRFSEINAPAPTYEQVAADYATIERKLNEAAGSDERLQAIADWDALRRRIDTWQALTHLRFNQDTTNEEYRKARDYCDELTPKLTELDVRMKRKLLASPLREEVAGRWGAFALDRWEVDVVTFDPVIEEDLVRESKLEAKYIELLASASFEFQGETCNLSSISKFHEDPDRPTRHDSHAVKWEWFASQRGDLDSIYDELVRLRTGMARKLGFEDYIGLGYKRMSRIDYGQAEVDRFRQEVREQVVPLAVELRREQAARLGVEPLMFWDEAIHDLAGNPRPQGDHDWMIDRAKEMFDGMDGHLSEFFRLMVDRELMDLKNRPTKAGGGFCTSFPTYGVPFIFANFNGTKGDVEVFTHEMGHAFQCYMSREQPLSEYLWPTMESCEIHSMGLEFLTWPHMEKFFGDGAERFRNVHLAQSLLFLPYGVAVDHFQHLVYERPEATADERFAMWRQVEAMYLPWRKYGDLKHPAEGGLWQLQRHIYLSPFYYIDYTLAQTCALQFWVKGEQDFQAAMRDYVALCRRGGEAPFQELVRSAGLVSPFATGCLREVVQQARGALGL